jgi:hypothetical protein
MRRGLALVMSAPPMRTCARVGLAQAGDHLDQFGLAVALHAGHADDLAGAHLEGDAAQRRFAQVAAWP